MAKKRPGTEPIDFGEDWKEKMAARPAPAKRSRKKKAAKKPKTSGTPPIDFGDDWNRKMAAKSGQ
jgi:hypothetical protein